RDWSSDVCSSDLFVTNVRNSIDFLLVYQISRTLNHFGFVYLVRNLRYNNTLPSVDFFEVRFRTDHHSSSTGFIGFTNTLVSVNHTSGWKVRCLDVSHDFLYLNVRIVNISQYTVNNLR